MASSRKSPKNNTPLARVTAVLRQHVKRGDRLVAGLSGGIDSVVMLDCLRRLAKKFHIELAALHVNHQISPAAGRWVSFCRRLCRSHKIPLTVVRVTVPRGDSLEAAARAARYRAFSLVPSNFVALAHNLDDQAETVLLQLLRGSGVKGASAMPVVREEKGVRRKAKMRLTPHASHLTPSILRPLLEIPRSEIEAYARRAKLEWVEDESNAAMDFDRNFLRHRVLPVIEQRYPAYRTTLLRASRHFAEAAQLLDELAAADVHLAGQGLDIGALRQLSATRIKNVVRHFVAMHGVRMPNAARLEECARQVRQARSGARMVIDLGSHELRRYARELRIVAKSDPPKRDFEHPWRGETRLRLPEFGGTLILKKCRGDGISLARLGEQPVTVRVRQGGEQFRPHERRPRRSLKNLLQETNIPPWQRARLPLLFGGKALIFVPGIGIDCAFRAAADEPAVNPVWQAD